MTDHRNDRTTTAHQLFYGGGCKEAPIDRALAFQLKGFEDQFPFLEAASFSKAYSVKVEWILREKPTESKRNRRKEDASSFVVKSNYCQIFRNRNIQGLLTDVEDAMEGSQAPQNFFTTTYVRSLAGGVRHYAPYGQPCNIVLSILRPLSYVAASRVEPGEWILEATWQVYPKGD